MTGALGVRNATHRYRMAVQTLIANRRTFYEAYRERFIRSIGAASALFAVMFLIAIVVAPLTRSVIVRVDMPAPTRTIVLEELIPEPPAPDEARMVAPEKLSVYQAPEAPAEPVPIREHVRREDAKPQLDPEAARVGRERAQKATEDLTKATASLDRSLRDLSTSLDQNVAYEPRARRGRTVRGGRTDGQLGSVGDGAAGSSASADLGASAVQGSLVAIEALSAAPPAATRQGTDDGGSGSAPGVHRSNASLLAVIRRYAAGIQYCYDTELKRDASLRGKLVVAITVAPSGHVADVTVVQNTVRSERLASCALSQIKDWKFPAIAEGVTTFQAPFVFTPPN